MNKHILTLMMIGLSITSTWAGARVRELFDYSNGPIHSRNGGVGFSGGWAYGAKNNWMVTKEALTNQRAEAASVRRMLSAPLTDTFYFGFTYSYGGTLSTTANDVFYLSNKTGAMVVNLAGIGLYRFSDKASYRLNLLGLSDAGKNHFAEHIFSYLDIATHLVVGKVTFNDGGMTVIVWQDPVDAEKSPIAASLVVTSATADPLPSVNQVGFVRYSSGTGEETALLRVDGILIGSTWADVAVESKLSSE